MSDWSRLRGRSPPSTQRDALFLPSVDVTPRKQALATQTTDRSDRCFRRLAEGPTLIGHRAAASCRNRHGGALGLALQLLQEADDLLAPDHWELSQESVDVVAGFEVIEEGLHRNAGADEAGRK